LLGQRLRLGLVQLAAKGFNSDANAHGTAL